jgi:hypothetical protein
MSDNIILIMGLKRKYAELAGALIEAEKVVRTRKAEMETVRDTLRMFGAEHTVATLRPRAPSKSNRYFENNECSRAVLDVLRRAQTPLTVRQIAEQVIETTGAEVTGRDGMRTVCDTVKKAMKTHDAMLVADASHPTRWALTQDGDRD